jgi:pimeloyl-ACP methyl ester carboxylesterase
MLIDFKNKIFEGSAGRKSLFDCSIPKDARAVIIFIHGYKGFKDWGAWNLMQDFFVKEKIGFVKFNLSHNGGTIDEPIDFPDLDAFGENRYTYEINDCEVIIKETERMISQECELNIPIYLLGHSRGGGVAILTGAKNEDVKAIFTLASISTIENRFPKGQDLIDWKDNGVYFVQNARTKQEMPHFYSFYEDFEENKESLNISKVLNELTKPLFAIHGDMDTSVSISEGQRIAHEANTDLIIIKGADHTFGAKHPWDSLELPEDLLTAAEKIVLYIKGLN